jgi:hypothetical protein
MLCYDRRYCFLANRSFHKVKLLEATPEIANDRLAVDSKISFSPSSITYRIN